MNEYRELLRPQFHFTAQRNWLNDPNGLVYYQGEYHLFFQYNSRGIRWDTTLSWGHAVSRDLVHWTQLPDAIEPDDDFGFIWSGSAVVDWCNTTGLGVGTEPPLVALYTAGLLEAGKPCVQCLASSHDRGRTWSKYKGNPVIGTIATESRDPKVIWHAPSQAWIMALYLGDPKHVCDYAVFRSPDLRAWSRVGDVSMPGTGECPDLFELAVDGNPADRRWVFWGGSGVYRLGTFDGTTFCPQSDVLTCESGPNGYAAQTWSDIPSADGRRIQLSWMRGGKYPYMPFNQQMSFPVALELRSFPEGTRLCRQPVKEIELLHDTTMSWEHRTVEPAKPLIPPTDGDLFDIRAVVDPGRAEAFGLYIHGTDLRYVSQRGAFTYLGREIAVDPSGGHVEIQLLVDRTSLELFVQHGKVSAAFCFLPEARDVPLEFYALGGSVEIVSLAVHVLRSAWTAKGMEPNVFPVSQMSIAANRAAAPTRGRDQA